MPRLRLEKGPCRHGCLLLSVDLTVVKQIQEASLRENVREYCEKIVVLCAKCGVVMTSGESSDAFLYKFSQELPKNRDLRMASPCGLEAKRASTSNHHDSKRSRSSPNVNSISATLFQQHASPENDRAVKKRNDAVSKGRPSCR
jgi:hypothetical protein